MSHTRVYSIDKDGDVIEYIDINNAHRHAMLIWHIMFYFYNDYFIDDVERPEWMPSDYIMSFSDLQLSGDMKPFWNLYHHPEVLEDHKLVFGSTFDRVIYFKEDFPKLISAYQNFIKMMTDEILKDIFGKFDFSGLEEFIEALKEIEKNENFIGATTCISLISSFWEEYDEDGKYMPYNIFKSKNHFNLFEDFKK